MSQPQQKEPQKISFHIEIQSEKTELKPVMEKRKFKTRISAATLEEAFKEATAKAATMKEADPAHPEFTVTDIRPA